MFLRRLPRAAIAGSLIGFSIAVVLDALVASGGEGADLVRAYFGFGLAFPATLITFPLLWLPHGDALFPIVALPLNGAFVGWIAVHLLTRSRDRHASPSPPAV